MPRCEYVQPETERDQAGAETGKAGHEPAGEGAGKHDECGLQWLYVTLWPKRNADSAIDPLKSSW